MNLLNKEVELTFEVYNEEGSIWQRIIRANEANQGLLLSPGEVLLLAQIKDIQWAAMMGDVVDKELAGRFLQEQEN